MRGAWEIGESRGVDWDVGRTRIDARTGGVEGGDVEEAGDLAVGFDGVGGGEEDVEPRVHGEGLVGVDMPLFGIAGHDLQIRVGDDDGVGREAGAGHDAGLRRRLDEKQRCEDSGCMSGE